MEESPKLAPLFPLGDVDSFAQSLVGAVPDQAEGLALLYEVTRELTAILDREELLRRIAQHVKRIVNYHVFTVMLWNETRQILESVFAMHYDDAIPARLRLRLNQGITGTAAGERRPVRIDDVRQDSRYVQFDTDVEVRSELVIPLLLQDRLIGVLDLIAARTGVPTDLIASASKLSNISVRTGDVILIPDQIVARSK